MNLTNNEWQHTLTSTPTESITNLVSVYDLFYDEDGKAWQDYDSWANIGITLSHDIICLNKTILGSSGAVDTSTELSLNDWQTFGIDLSMPEYDPRAHQKYLTDDDLKSYNSSYTGYCFPSYGDVTGRLLWSTAIDVPVIYDKESAIPPSTLKMFINNGILRSKLDTEVEAEPSWSNYTAPSIGVGGSSTHPSTDIVLSGEDSVFKSTLVTQDNYYAYNKMFLRLGTTFSAVLLYRILGLNAAVRENTANAAYNLASKTWSSEEIAAICGTSTTPATTIPNAIGQENWFRILKGSFVWVRAPFYADYIKTETFNQDLNQDASVVHANLMLSGAGDFKRYDEELTATASQEESTGQANNDHIGTVTTAGTSTTGLSDASVPYVPCTSPTVDFYTSVFLSGLDGNFSYGTTDTNYSPKIASSIDSEELEEQIDDMVSGNDPVIGGIPKASYNRKVETSNPLIPFNYLDPESRSIEADIEAMGRIPTVVPKDGNAYIDGRIFSPTIDEIWYIIKKMISGRLSDIVTTTEGSEAANLNRAKNLDLAIPYGNASTRQNDTDSSLVEVPNAEFNFTYGDTVKGTSSSKVGEPLAHEYRYQLQDGNSSLNGEYLVTTKFINQNDAIVYPIYQSLKDISDDITTFDTSTTSSTDDTPGRSITNFSAWDSIGKGTDVVTDNETITSGTWAPRGTPYSFRELEALVKGNKFNLITLARFLKENFAVTGKLGKTNNYGIDDTHNTAAGSLYQMHREYNYDSVDPNTWYNIDGTTNGYSDDGKTVVGTKDLWNDIDNRSTEQIENYVERTRRGFGSSDDIPAEQEKGSSFRVYLAADGTWRNIDRYTRIPVLRDDY